jgi:hypothetical protein
MARRLNWGKARRYELATSHPIGKRERKKRAQERRQWVFSDFVKRHEIRVFQVRSVERRRMGQTGTSIRGPWAICVPCVKKKGTREDG